MFLSKQGAFCHFPEGQRNHSVHGESGEKTGEGGGYCIYLDLPSPSGQPLSPEVPGKKQRFL